MYYDIDDIKQISILDVIPFHVKNSKTRKAKKDNILFEKCPFCDKKWHFQANPRLYNSFNSCCKGGSVIDFASELTGLGFKDSISWLGNNYGINPSQKKKPNKNNKSFLDKFREDETKRIKAQEDEFLEFIKFIGDEEMLKNALSYERDLIHYILYCKEVGAYV